MQRPLLWRLLGALPLLACASSTMKVPAAARANPEWPVNGYTEQSFREPDITLGSRTVRALRRTRRAGTNTQPNALSVAPRSYQFELASAQSMLAGACTEVVMPKKLWLLRFGQGEVQLDCTCREGEQLRTVLTLVDGKGSLQLGNGARYEVTPLRETVEGKQESGALGYAVTNAAGTGALQRSGHGRAWPPSGLDARAESDLSCAYAALLLYRPEP